MIYTPTKVYVFVIYILSSFVNTYAASVASREDLSEDIHLAVDLHV